MNLKISKMVVVMFGLLFTLNSVEALNSLTTGFQATSNQTREVNAHGTCKKVKAGGTGIFIPTKNSTEWSGFRINAYRVGASLSECCTWQNYTYQCGTTGHWQMISYGCNRVVQCRWITLFGNPYYHCWATVDTCWRNTWFSYPKYCTGTRCV